MKLDFISEQAAGGDRQAKPQPWYLLPLTLLFIIGVGVALRSRGLLARSFWFDEAFSWRLTQFSYGELLTRVGNDNHPPLYFLILKVWASVFGESMLALRGLSVLFAALTILGMYLFVAEAYSGGKRNSDNAAATRRWARGLGLFAATLVAISVFQIRWGWEARMYALGTTLTAFSSWTLFRALHATSNVIGKWVCFAVTAVLMAYTHYYCLFVIVAQFVFLLGYLLVESRARIISLVKDQRFHQASLAGCLIVVGFAPQLPTLMKQRSQVQANFWTEPINRWDFPRALFQMFLEPEDPIMENSTCAMITILIVPMILLLLWHPTRADLYLLSGIMVPVLICVLSTRFDTKIFHPRYFLFTHLFLLAAIARAVWRIPSGPRLPIAAIIILNGVLLYITFYDKMDFANRPGAQAVAEHLKNHRLEQEPVISCSGLYYFANFYHADNRANYFCYHDGNGVVHYKGGAVVIDDELITKEQLYEIASPRAWVINMDGAGWKEPDVPVPDHWRLISTRRYREAYGVQGTMILQEWETKTQSADVKLKGQTSSAGGV